MEKTYAIVKDFVVINTIVIEEEKVSLLNNIKEAYEATEAIEVLQNQIVEVGYTYDGLNFTNPNPPITPSEPEDNTTPEE
jgi:hypothetical protein